MAAFVNHND